MAEITVELIKTLREKTNAGMMDCKAALAEAGGDLEAAETVLRKRGIADAEKKAGRAAKEGVIASRIAADGKTGFMVEVNCETDFVAKNDNFQTFVNQILDHVEKSGADAADLSALLAQDYDSEQSLEEFVKVKVGELGENMGIGRFVHYTVDGTGAVATYIHMQGRVGVLAEVNCGKDATLSNGDFETLLKDLTMHIAAAQPDCVDRDGVSSDKIEGEKDIFREQMKDKPADIIERIIEGKMSKFYSQHCLLEQAFIKDGDKTIQDLLDEVGKAAGDTITVARFDRYALGEEA